jgi:hypothetical protein
VGEANCDDSRCKGFAAHDFHYPQLQKTYTVLNKKTGWSMNVPWFKSLELLPAICRWYPGIRLKRPYGSNKLVLPLVTHKTILGAYQKKNLIYTRYSTYASSRMKEINQVPITTVSFSTIFWKTPNKFQRWTIMGRNFRIWWTCTWDTLQSAFMRLSNRPLANILFMINARWLSGCESTVVTG